MSGVQSVFGAGGAVATMLAKAPGVTAGILQHARTRPVPHEGFHANAGYFYFFAHYYAAKVINTLPEARREEWHALLRPHVTKTQWTSGAMSDFMDAGYALTSATAFSILALEEGMKR